MACAQVYSTCISSAEKGSGHRTPFLTQKLFPVDSCSQTKKLIFFNKVVTLGILMLLRLCSMLRSRWPIHNVLNGTFGGFLSHNALFLCQDFIGLFIYRIGPFCVYYDFRFCVFMTFLCVWMCMPLPLCVSWTFSLPPPSLFILSCLSDLSVFIFYYYYYYYLF